MSTPAVYRHFDELNPDADPQPPDADDLLAAIDEGDVHDLAAYLRNDLQEAAFDLRPDLSDVIDLGEREGALRGIVSGSGPTCVFLADVRRRGARRSPARSPRTVTRSCWSPTARSPAPTS